jgi:hypothetical protein
MRRRARSTRPAQRPDAPLSHQGRSWRPCHRRGFSLRSRPRHHHIPSPLGQHPCSMIPRLRRVPLMSRRRTKRRPSLRPSSGITAAAGASRRKTATPSTSARTATFNRWPAPVVSIPKPGARIARSTKCGEYQRSDKSTTTGTRSSAFTPKTPAPARPTHHWATAVDRRASGVSPLPSAPSSRA